jgi:hypothetical protein
MDSGNVFFAGHLIAILVRLHKFFAGKVHIATLNRDDGLEALVGDVFPGLDNPGCKFSDSLVGNLHTKSLRLKSQTNFDAKRMR